MDKGKGDPAFGEMPNMASIVPNVPSMLDCTEPAAVRIEIYVPREGVDHLILDGVSYYCQRHAGDVLEVISWDATDDIRIERTTVTGSEVKCGTSRDFTAMRPTDSATAVLGEDHPIVETAVNALTFGGWVDVADISRDRAAMLLDSWAHGKELSALEREAVLARFPEATATPVAQAVEAYELGREIGARSALKDVNAETWSLLMRLDEKLREAREGHIKAHSHGYVDGLTAAMEEGRMHAFTVSPFEDGRPDHWVWLCGCKWVTHQYPAGTEQTPIHDRLMNHVREATAIDARSARAHDVEGCSCPAELVPARHWHVLTVRRMASTGTLEEIYVEAAFTGGRVETLCWPLTKLGVARAQAWVDRHGAAYDSGARVEPGELARWLR